MEVIIIRDWLKEKRKAKEMNQQEVANSIGVSRVSYSRYENDKRKPNVEKAKELGELLGFEWTEFYK